MSDDRTSVAGGHTAMSSEQAPLVGLAPWRVRREDTHCVVERASALPGRRGDQIALPLGAGERASCEHDPGAL